MNRYFTSDFHLGHKNIIKYADRPFNDVSRMNHAILSNIYQTVTPDDELWILGDIAMGDTEHNLALLETIPCSIVIVAGNHDRCHPYNGAKHERWIAQYAGLSNVTDLILGNTHLNLLNGQQVTVSHFPYAEGSWESLNGRRDKFAAYRPEDEGGWLLCGHVHQSWLQKGRMINVGVDVWGGWPVSEQSLVDVITAGRGDLPAIPWTDAG